MMNERWTIAVKRRHMGVVGIGAAVVMLSGCTYVPDEANPVEWYKGAQQWIGAYKTDEQRSAEALAKTLPMPNRESPFPNLSSVPERRTDLEPLEKSAATDALTKDRVSALTIDAAGRMKDAELAAPPNIVTSGDGRRRRLVPRRKAGGGVTPPKPPARVRPPPAPVIPDMPTDDTAPATSDQKSSVARPMAPDFASIRDSWHALKLPVADRLSAPARPRHPLSHLVGGVERSNETARKKSTLSPRAGGKSGSGKPSTPDPLKNLRFGPPPSDIDPFNTSAEPSGVTPAAQGGDLERSADVRPLGVIQFANGSAAISKIDRMGLRGVAAAHRKHGGTLRVVGHASGPTGARDPVKNRMVNFNMSLDRASAVAKALVELGIDPAAISVGAAAATLPAASESTAMGMARNRRAEIFLDK